ncbi:MAG: response regulator [Mariprofundaceae bacterium]
MHKNNTSLFSLFSHLSLRAKLTTVLLMTAIIPVIVIATYSYNSATASYKNTSDILDTEHLKQVTSHMSNTLDEVPNDLTFLSQFHDLNRYLLWHNIGEDQEAKRWLNTTTRGFQSFMNSNKIYMQLRVIDVEGWEILRIDRNNKNQISVSHKRDLQRKNNTDYFTETMKLTHGQFYVSRLNLNREHGKIQEPFTPVIRYALPIIDINGVGHGIIILNLFANHFLGTISHIEDADHQDGDALYVANQDSFYLSHPEQDKTFGFDLGKDDNLINQHPELWEAIQESPTGTLLTNTISYTYDRLYPLKQYKDIYWSVIHAVPSETALAEFVSFQQVFFSIIFILFVSLIFLSRPLIQKIVSPLRQVTSNLQRLERGETNIHTVTYHGHDEIRDIVDSANGMSQRIIEAITQANAIAQGDFRADISPQSSHDELGIALQNMTNTLRAVTSIVESVATGNLSHDISIKGEHDQLGISLNQMISTLRDTVDQANIIACGDFRAEVNPRSNQDTLGIALQDMTLTLREVSQVTASIAMGDYYVKVNVKGEYDQLGRSIEHMTKFLKGNAIADEQQNWLKSNIADTVQALQNQKNIRSLANHIMQLLPEILQANHGACYIMENEKADEYLALEGGYALKSSENISNHFKLGEGLVGQCGLEQKSILLTQVPDDHIKIQSGLGESTPSQILVVPLMAENKLMGVIELATLDQFTSIQREFLEQIKDTIGMAIYTVQSAQRTHALLEESQSMTEELQAQEEELRESNDTLETKANELKESEERLQVQQEELRENNEQLVEQNKLVEEQKSILENARNDLEQQASELAEASQYKSDFLSNMSHELRTPLNSLLILSDMLAGNKDGNLSDKQVEFAQTIHGSGEDLLELINSILDLAKIEAGKMDLDPHYLPITDITDAMQRIFDHVAIQNDVQFRVEIEKDVPKQLFNDAMRIKQVLKNLLSNAFKFTEEGEVTLTIGTEENNFISFKVTDSGTGIAMDKIQAIFEAFQQEDGSTSRKYGGTGLGLSISRELSQLLGGHIEVESDQGKGSCFTLIIPAKVDSRNETDFEPKPKVKIRVNTPAKVVSKIQTSETTAIEIPTSENLSNRLKDDRDMINGNKTILIIEDDPKFAKVLQDMVRAQGFKALNALQGDHGLAMAQQYIPDAILLDLQLPMIDGISLLKRLKQHPEMRHIPIHVISCMDEKAEQQVLQSGAISFLRKPVKQSQLESVMVDIKDFIARDIHKLLIVEDNKLQREALVALLDADNVEIITSTTAKKALKLLHKEVFDCMVLDLTLHGTSGEELLDQINAAGDMINHGHPLPVVIHTGKDLDEKEVERLQSKAKTVIVKGSNSIERLLAETTLFLHQVEAHLPEEKRVKLEGIREKDVELTDKCILLVDDDIRNIYSLSSMLEEFGLKILIARNGKEALSELKEHADDVDLVIMDIMMPEMDGYEAMSRIRKIEQHKKLPIIALTAKAMKGDREKCIASGASDYIGKPVNTDKLISLMRVWLSE